MKIFITVELEKEMASGILESMEVSKDIKKDSPEDYGLLPVKRDLEKLLMQTIELIHNGSLVQYKITNLPPLKKHS